MTTVLDKNVVKQALRELIQEEPELFEKMLIKTAGEEDLKIANRSKLEAIVKEDFEEYEEVFKALA